MASEAGFCSAVSGSSRSLLNLVTGDPHSCTTACGPLRGLDLEVVLGEMDGKAGLVAASWQMTALGETGGNKDRMKTADSTNQTGNDQPD